LLFSVEHLPPDVLELFPRTLFSYYRPQLIIITTPNADFNCLFPGWQPGQYRDEDHRFEWTRQQFHQWCSRQAERYGYQVQFEGVGVFRGRPFDPKYGHCTQAAVFSQPAAIRTLSPALATDSQSYSLLKRIEYPWYSTESTDDEVLSELHQSLPMLARCQQRQRSLNVNGEVEIAEPFPSLIMKISVADVWKLLSIRQKCHGDQSRLLRIIQQAISCGKDPHLRSFDEQILTVEGIAVVTEEEEESDTGANYDSECEDYPRRRRRISGTFEPAEDELANKLDGGGDNHATPVARWSTAAAADQTVLLASSAETAPQLQWSKVERPEFESGW
jgi:hypothetical protein